MEALTKTGRIVTKTIEGDLPEIKSEAFFDELEILSVRADYWKCLQSICLKRRLSASTLASFFVDFSRTLACGLTVGETIDSLRQTSVDLVLKDGLTLIANSINDGRSLKEAFENPRCFPKLVITSLSAAEKSGRVPEIAAVLGDFFKFKNDSRKRIIGALVYPAVVFAALTAASVIISVNLVPQLARLLPASSIDNLGTKMLLAYAMFMKSYWGTGLIAVVGGTAGAGYWWNERKEDCAKYIYGLPLAGQTLKEMEFARLFLSLSVYQNSGVPIIESLTNICHEDGSYVTDKLINIREKVIKGFSLAEAFKTDDFFPVFIWQNLSKGQKAGQLGKYMEDIYRFYEQKSKDSIAVLISLINPVLLSMAVAFLGFIVCNFFLPVYRQMANMGGVFR